MIVPLTGPRTKPPSSPGIVIDPECLKLLRATRPPIVLGDLVAVIRPRDGTREETIEMAVVLDVDPLADEVEAEFADHTSMIIGDHRVVLVLPPPQLGSPIFWPWLAHALRSVDPWTARQLVGELHKAVRTLAIKREGLPW